MILPVSINEFMYGTKKRERGVEGYQRLKESYHEASRAIKYIDIIRLVTGDKNKSVVHYSNLGFFQIFGEIDDVTELERYIPETLKKLYLYDDEHKGELITTLQMYLRNNQSIKKTADAMFVHYKTISYRLEKIKQICAEEKIEFLQAKSKLKPENTWQIFGPPAVTIRWCCSVHKTTPQIMQLREVLQKPDFTGMAFTGVRLFHH